MKLNQPKTGCPFVPIITGHLRAYGDVVGVSDKVDSRRIVYKRVNDPILLGNDMQ